MLVQFLDRIERLALQLVADARRIGQVEDRVGAFAKGHALIKRGEKSATEIARTAAQAAGRTQDHEARQIL